LRSPENKSIHLRFPPLRRNAAAEPERVDRFDVAMTAAARRTASTLIRPVPRFQTISPAAADHAASAQSCSDWAGRAAPNKLRQLNCTK
jgi:hypothetical protein